MTSVDNCFACGRPLLGLVLRRVDTRDDQTVFVGPECFQKVARADEAGYQPPRGGPRLYLLRARRLRKRVEELERRENKLRNRWEFNLDGVHIGSLKAVECLQVRTAIITARLLQHAVVVTADDTTLRFFALPIAGTR